MLKVLGHEVIVTWQLGDNKIKHNTKMTKIFKIDDNKESQSAVHYHKLNE